MGEHKPTTLRGRQNHFGRSAERITEELEAAGAIVLVLDQNGRIGMSTHGMNHAKAVEVLACGIHLALSDHDQHVLAGAAGAEAQACAADCAAANGEAA